MTKREENEILRRKKISETLKVLYKKGIRKPAGPKCGGWKLSDEQRNNIRIRNIDKGIFPPSRKGCRMPEEAKRKISIANKGDKSHFWRGGISDDSDYHKIWYSNLDEESRRRISWLRNRRNRRKREAEGSHTYGEWLTLKKQYNYKCQMCFKKEPEITLTEDHIIPLSKCGSDFIENIQPLCKSCNSKKSNKVIIKM